MALIEIGHISQTFQIAATTLGINTWLTGAMDDSKIEALLDLQNPAEQVLFFVGAGYGANQPLPGELASLVKL